MTTDAPGADGAAQQAGQDVPALAVITQYIKDLSFEVPNGPSILLEAQRTQPEININVGVVPSQIAERTFEVVLQINSECKVGGRVGFLMELSYAGVFTINVAQEHLQAVMLIECPRLLFPFARNIVADMSRDGGFPPLMLTPIDFVALYQQQMERAREQGATPEGPVGTA